MGPVAVSVTGESFNLTSEEIATQLAIQLKAEKMIGFAPHKGYTTRTGKLFPNCSLTKHRRASKSWSEKATTFPAPRVFRRGAVKSLPQRRLRRSHLISYQEDGALIAVVSRRYRDAD